MKFNGSNFIYLLNSLYEIDNKPKNIIFSSNDMYDMDTIQGIPNDYGIENIDSYWKDKKGYCGYEYDEMITSKIAFGPRGEYYHLVLIKDNKIIAFGDEQGNYCGGIYTANDEDYERFSKEKEHLKINYSELYEKIKDIPLANKNEYPYRK